MMLHDTIVPSILSTSNVSALLIVEALAGLVVVALAIYGVLSRMLDMERNSSSEVELSPPQLLSPVGTIVQSYFENQFDFFRDGFKATSSSVFQFKLNRHNVIALSGEEGRRIFFREKDLNLYEGFQVLIETVFHNDALLICHTIADTFHAFVQIPTGLDPHQLNGIYKRIISLQKPENLQSSELSSLTFHHQRGQHLIQTSSDTYAIVGLPAQNGLVGQ
jgi:hypothetical protein